MDRRIYRTTKSLWHTVMKFSSKVTTQVGINVKTVSKLNDEHSFSSPLTRMASEAVKRGYLSSYLYSIITRYPVFSLIMGQTTSLRFAIAIEIYRTIKYPWHTVKRLSSKVTGRHARVRIGKNIMEVPEDMFAYFLTGDYYEKNVSYWIEKLLLSTDNKVFYDIGANYGYYCLKLSNYASHIYAFEPVSRTSHVLLKNIQRNNLENITFHKLGLSDKHKSIEINLYSSSGHNSLFLRDLPKDDPVKLVGQEVVSLVSLDVLIQDKKLNPPDLIKIDVEGGELYALKGARETIIKHRPALVIEFSEPAFKDAGYSRSDLVAELEVNNYVIFGIPTNFEDLKVYPLAQFDFFLYVHLFTWLPHFINFSNQKDIFLGKSIVDSRTQSCFFGIWRITLKCSPALIRCKRSTCISKPRNWLRYIYLTPFYICLGKDKATCCSDPPSQTFKNRKSIVHRACILSYICHSGGDRFK